MFTSIYSSFITPIHSFYSWFQDEEKEKKGLNIAQYIHVHLLNLRFKHDHIEYKDTKFLPINSTG